MDTILEITNHEPKAVLTLKANTMEVIVPDWTELGSVFRNLTVYHAMGYTKEWLWEFLAAHNFTPTAEQTAQFEAGWQAAA